MYLGLPPRSLGVVREPDLVLATNLHHAHAPGRAGHRQDEARVVVAHDNRGLRADGRLLAAAKTEQKNQALKAIGKALQDNAQTIIAANREDLAQAEKDNLVSYLTTKCGLLEVLMEVIKMYH